MSTTPQSVPVVPAQPNEPRYPVSATFMVQTFTRSAYNQTYGQQAPPWDKTRPIKRWFDSSQSSQSGDGDVTYNVWNDVVKAMQPLTMPKSIASTVNLPGAYSYPPYVILPTPATTQDGYPIDPKILCLKAEADNVAALIGPKASVADPSGFGFDYGIIYNGDPRRQWIVKYTGTLGEANDIVAASLVQQMYANGVGAPGKWIDGPVVPVWVTGIPPTGEQDTRPEVSVPARPLMANERIAPGLSATQGAVIERTDMGTVAIQTAPPAQPQLDLSALMALVQKIVTYLGIK